MLNFLLDNTSATLPLKVALIFEDKTYAYAELCGLTQCLVVAALQTSTRRRRRSFNGLNDRGQTVGFFLEIKMFSLTGNQPRRPIWGVAQDF
jgi:hypothetical protein